MSVEITSPEFKLPLTMDWYRQAANWLVGISTGAIVVGLSLFESSQRVTLTIKVLLLAAGLFFLLAIVSGVLFHFFIINFANSNENYNEYLKRISQEKNEETKQALRRDRDSENNKIQYAQRWYVRCYWALIFSFISGVILLAITLIVFVFTDTRAANATSYAIIPVQLPSMGTQGDTQIFLIEEKSGRTWVLTQSSNGVLVWQTVLLQEIVPSVPLLSSTLPITATVPITTQYP